MTSKTTRTVCAIALFAVGSLFTGHADAVPPDVRGRISGQEKLVPDVYSEAARPDAHRWTWREPSSAVAAQYRVLSGNPSRDLCIAALASGGAGAQDPILMTITGGRVVPTTIVVSPGTKLSFKNFDPFNHQLYMVDSRSFGPDPQTAGGAREWTAPPGANRFEVRDKLFPSVRTFVIVDPSVVQVSYPGRDGTFGFALSGGDYVLKAFFNGRQVGKSVSVTVKEHQTIDLKDPLNVGEGADAK